MPLVAGHKRKMHAYFKLGLDQKLVANSKELVREVKRDFERQPQFLDEFVRKREFEHLELFSRKLYDCSLAFQGKVSDVLAKSKAAEAALVSLQTCPMDKQQLHRILGTLQGIVSELELASYSNLEWWAAELDQRAQAILLTRLEELVKQWIISFKEEANDGDARAQQPTEYMSSMSEAARTRLEIKIKSSVLLVEPSVEQARATWMNQLALSMGMIANLPRIRHTAYSEFSDVKLDTRQLTYQELLYKLPAKLLEKAYRMIADRSDECEAYVGSWLNYQALWDLDSANVISKLGDHMGDWLAVVTELRASRSLFDTEETNKTFGAITVDFAKVQSGVVIKFDAWHKEMMGAFAGILHEKIRKMLGDLKDARDSLERFSADKGTSDAVDFLNRMQVFKTDKLRWEEMMKSLREGERMLHKHRFKFAGDWTYVDMIEGEWMAFIQIYTKKELELSEKIATLQAKIIDWDKSVSERIKIAVSEWNANKPTQGDLMPTSALDQLSLFQTNVSKLQQDSSDIARAKDALSMENLSGIKLNTIVAEISDLKEVWMSLVKPHDDLLTLGDTAWNAVIPRKVRTSLEEVQSQLRELPVLRLFSRKVLSISDCI